MNRQQLETAIFAYLHRASFRSPVPDFDAVPTFVALAQEDINADLRARPMILRADQPLDGRYIPLPCDYIEASDVRWRAADAQAWPPGGEMTFKPRAELAQLAGGTWRPGPPCHYDVIGDAMEVWPFPPPGAASDPPTVAAYVVEMAYYARQALGPEPTDTTPVLTALPSVYLWAALTKAAPFLRDDDRVATWKGEYQGAVLRANAEQERARSAGSRLVQTFRRLG